MSPFDEDATIGQLSTPRPVREPLTRTRGTSLVQAETGRAAPVVLVHGSMHGAWCWRQVIEELQRQDVTASAIDLPGHGDRAGEADRATLDTYAETVLAAVDAASGPIVLVGHSMAGQVVARVASQRPQAIQHLVLLNAQILLDGESSLDILPPEVRARYHELASAQGGVTYRIHDEEIHARWMQDLPRDDPRVIDALSRITPQPLAPLTEAAGMQGFFGQGVEATYIRSLDDVGAPRERTERFVARLPFNVPVVPVPGSHDAMLSQPGEVARVIASVAYARAGSREYARAIHVGAGYGTAPVTSRPGTNKKVNA